MNRGFRSQSWLDKSFLTVLFIRGTPFGISADSIDANVPFPIHFCVSDDDVYSLQSVIKELTSFNEYLNKIILDKEPEY